MAYSEDIIATNSDHLWTFDGSYSDSVGSITGVQTGGSATGTSLCTDSSNSWQSNTIDNDDIVLATSTDIENSEQSVKAVGGWFQVSKVNAHPCRIYGEGDTQPTYQIVMAMGNNVMFEIVDGVGDVAQVYGIALVSNRAYHIMTTFNNGQLEFFIDGISQGLNSLVSTTLRARTEVGVFADPSYTVGVGGDTVLLQAPVNGHYNYWGTWEGTIPTTTQIREELFAKGALAEIEISSQANLDSYADTERGNVPLAFNITGTSLDLAADNITFDDRCSLHIRWEGTGTLNWTNTNGSTASTAIATNGGTVNVINPTSLTLETSPSGVLDGAEIRIYDNENASNSNYDTELYGVESNSGDTFIYSHSGTVNTILVQVLANGYEEIEQEHTVCSSSETLTLFPSVEENE